MSTMMQTGGAGRGGDDPNEEQRPPLKSHYAELPDFARGKALEAWKPAGVTEKHTCCLHCLQKAGPEHRRNWLNCTRPCPLHGKDHQGDLCPLLQPMNDDFWQSHAELSRDEVYASSHSGKYTSKRRHEKKKQVRKAKAASASPVPSIPDAGPSNTGMAAQQSLPSPYGQPMMGYGPVPPVFPYGYQQGYGLYPQPYQGWYRAPLAPSPLGPHGYGPPAPPAPTLHGPAGRSHPVAGSVRSESESVSRGRSQTPRPKTKRAPVAGDTRTGIDILRDNTRAMLTQRGEVNIEMTDPADATAAQPTAAERTVAQQADATVAQQARAVPQSNELRMQAIQARIAQLSTQLNVLGAREFQRQVTELTAEYHSLESMAPRAAGSPEVPSLKVEDEDEQVPSLKMEDEDA